MKWGAVEVRPEGPKDARIVLVGEAPGDREVVERRPFVGRAGKILDDVLREVGIRREECYVTNLCKVQPMGNNFGNFYEDKQRKKQSYFLQEQLADLYVELQEVKPNVIVALGNEPLKALTHLSGITDWRGSVLRSPLGKVIPTYHPAAVGRQWSWRPITVFDFRRIEEQSGFPEVRIAERRLLTNLAFTELIQELERLSRSTTVAFDIETETGQINCLSLADSRKASLCVPFWFGASGSLWSAEQEIVIWELVRKILEGPARKIAQNGQFDMWYLRKAPYNIEVKNMWLDTMVAAHLIYPELPKGLDFLCSIYTDQPYYKHLGKTKDMQTFFKYSALDSVVTYEIAFELIKELKEYGMWEFYQQNSLPLMEALYNISLRGVSVDVKQMKATRTRLKEEVARLQVQLNETAGRELNVGSNKQMTEWLYTELKLPKQMRNRKATGQKTLSADDEAIIELKRNNDIPALGLVQEIRKRNKLITTYLEVKLDGDKRIRTSYLITGTKTGRLSSRSTPDGTGTNLQNIPRGDFRAMFIPDPGCVFVSADLSQAEARVVAYLARERRLVDVFESGGDIHRKNASNIFHKGEEEVTKEERTLAKRIIHASNYGMGPLTFARIVGITTAEAKRLLNLYFATYPGIRLWHMSIQAQLKRTRELVTPFGRKRQFLATWNEALIKEVYAYIPQSTVSDLLNSGLVELEHKLANTNSSILLQVHDSVLVQCPEQDAELVAKVIKRCLERPLLVNNMEMTIPVDVKIGRSWAEV